MNRTDSTMRIVDSESDGLRGLDNIAAYAQYGRNVVRELVESHGFPAVQFFGAWESSKSLIDAWRKNRILSTMGVEDEK